MKSIIHIILICIIILTTCQNIAAEYLILTDTASPFYIKEKDTQSWIHLPYAQYDIEEEPYVNMSRLNEAEERLNHYIKIQKENGYNAFVFGDMQRMLTFEKIGILSKDSKEYKRAKIYRNFFNRQIEKHKVRFFVSSDFQIMNPKIKEYLKEHDLQETNAHLFSELFEEMPGLAGITLRIGEGGSHYATDPFYSSDLYYTNIKRLHALLDKILPIFQKHNKTLIFRSWTVGIGELGDLMYNEETYKKAFSRYYNETNLIISIKYGSGDFWYFVEHNPTLGKGNLPQIIEFQLRREYEGYGVVTNFLSNYYGDIINKQKKHNLNFKGIYNWLLLGGWDNANNNPFFTDKTSWTKIDNYILPKIITNDSIDINKTTLDYLGKSFDENIAYPLNEYIQDSLYIIQSIYYIESFAQKNLSIRGVTIPKLMWIYWDTPVHDRFGLIHIVKNTDNISYEVEKTILAYKLFKEHEYQIIANTTDADLIKNLEYQDRLFSFLIKYKSAFLYYYYYLDNHDPKYFYNARHLTFELDEEIDRFEKAYSKNNEFNIPNFNEVKKFNLTVRSLWFRNILSVIATIGFIFLSIIPFFKWKKKDKPALRWTITGFIICCIIMIASYAGIKDNITFSFFFGIILTSSIFINQFLYRIFRLKAIIAYKEWSFMITITSMSAFLALINTFGTLFVPDRIWIIIYEFLTEGITVQSIMILSLFCTYYLYKTFRLWKKTSFRRNDIWLIIVADLMTFIITSIIAWELFLHFLPLFNQGLQLVPSILFSHGVGPDMINMLSILK
jgi:hypothetical protein